ncbi:CvpA family protein [Staphylococcus equorum]|uniref:CvpA family protein n=1 Tax=Staphylococcus equorum TaxID=246432 RepID=A0A9X4R140_9STAP|nr:CvpA family protein [Staphylococcus equorum]MDG0843420.1 CvpA family protein [Staphylococcus equorum]MDG0858731.1 CvpA family protein [Staphylococcus equorum]
MIFDILIVIVFIYIGMIGFRRGVWFSALHLGATLFSLWVAQQLYLQISQRLELFIPFPKTQAYDLNYAFQFDNLQQRFDHIIAFLTVATITKMICYGVIVVFDKVIQYQGLNLISRFTGMVMGIISSMIICTTLLYGAALYPLEFIQQQLSSSIIAEYMLFHIPYVSTLVLNI